MRLSTLALAAFAATFALPAGAWWSGPHVHGNDTGGIIPWSPAAMLVYRDLAGAHCARWNKVAIISSIHPVDGDYIGFRCYFPPGYDPVKARYGILSVRG